MKRVDPHFLRIALLLLIAISVWGGVAAAGRQNQPKMALHRAYPKKLKINENQKANRPKLVKLQRAQKHFF